MIVSIRDRDPVTAIRVTQCRDPVVSKARTMCPSPGTTLNQLALEFIDKVTINIFKYKKSLPQDIHSIDELDSCKKQNFDKICKGQFFSLCDQNGNQKTDLSIR